MKLLWYLFGALIILFVILFSVYFIDNPADKPFSEVKYPYILYINPHQVPQDSSAEIVFSSILEMNKSNLAVIIVDPNGNKFVMDFFSDKSITYPDDFEGATTRLTGNYSISVVSLNDNTLLISSDFLVLVNPYLSSFSNFIFGSGLAITIGVIGTLATIVYQIVSQHNQDRNRRLDERAKWMIENNKFYMSLISDSSGIYSSFFQPNTQIANYSKPNIRLVLYFTIQFYSDYLKFKEVCGYYYFDDYQSEDFIAQLDDKIFGMMDEMTGEYSELRKFFKITSQSSFINNPAYPIYFERAKLWLSDREKARDFYLAHLVYSWILLSSINRALLITYSSKDEIKNSMDKDIQLDKENLKSYIQELNLEFYGDSKEQYYNLFNNKGKVRM